MWTISGDGMLDEIAVESEASFDPTLCRRRKASGNGAADKRARPACAVVGFGRRRVALTQLQAFQCVPPSPAQPLH